MLESLCEAMLAGERLHLSRCSRWIASELVQIYEEWKSELRKSLESCTAVLYYTKATGCFDQTLHVANLGRRVFITKGESLGLGPAHIQGGDIVCILYRRPKPFVLRPNPDECTFRLIGEAHVNGIMNGEALTMREKHSWEDQIVEAPCSASIVPEESYFHDFGQYIRPFAIRHGLAVVAENGIVPNWTRTISHPESNHPTMATTHARSGTWTSDVSCPSLSTTI
jgi:hypothetical protein